MKIIEYIKASSLYSVSKNIVLYRGISNPKILFIGEAPTKEDNRLGIPFSDKNGQMLNSWIKAYNLQSYVGIINSIPLLPLTIGGIVKKPTTLEIEYFRPFVNYMIEKLDPKIIICVGEIACRSVLKTTIGLSRHNLIKKGKYYFTAVYHPSYYFQKGIDGLDDFKNTYIEISAVLEFLPKIKFEPSEQQDISKILNS